MDNVRKGRRHRRGSTSSPAAAASAAGVPEPCHPQPAPSDSATVKPSMVVDAVVAEPSTSGGRVMRLDLGCSSPGDAGDLGELLSTLDDWMDAAMVDDLAFVATSPSRAAVVPQPVESPLARPDHRAPQEEDVAALLQPARTSVAALIKKVGCQAVPVTAAVGTSAERSSPTLHTVGLQTPVGPPLGLPAGWSVRRLVQLAMAEPARPPRALALAVSREFDAPLPGDQFLNT